MSLPHVIRGQPITQLQMDLLAQLANQKLNGHYIFPQSVWQVPDREHLLKFDLADWGVDPGGIVVVKDERKVYQLHPAGSKSWETFGNWVLLDWRFVDATFGGILDNPRYHDKLRFEQNVPTGQMAVVVAPWPRASINTPPLGGLESPEVWQYVGPGGPGDLANWRHVGGAQEVGSGLLAIRPEGGERIGKPLWTQELRAIQTDAITVISDSLGRARRPYLYSERRMSFAGTTDLTTPGDNRRLLYLNQIGARVNLDGAALHLPQTCNYVRMYQDLYYYARGPGSYVDVIVTLKGPIAGETFSDSANWLNPPYGLPAGVHFNFKILNEPVGTDTRYLWGYVDINRQPDGGGMGTWTDTTGIGTVDITTFRGIPVANGNIRWGIRNDPAKFGVLWNGGDFLLKWALDSPGSTAAVAYNLQWRLSVPISQLVTKSRHKSSQVYRAKLPEVAVEAVGYNSMAPFPLEIASVVYRPKEGDMRGAFVGRTVASQGLHHLGGTVTGDGPYELKYPWGGFSGTTAPTWSLVPYPCYRFVQGQNTTNTTNFPRWTPGVDEPGNATIYDLCVTRKSTRTGQLYYDNTDALTVSIGVKIGSAFVKMFDVTVPAGQAVGHADQATLAEVVIMDNEPLFYQAPTGSVSCVQVLALRRKERLVGPYIISPGNTADGVTGPFDLRGAQMGFSESYNETADLLESL